MDPGGGFGQVSHTKIGLAALHAAVGRFHQDGKATCGLTRHHVVLQPVADHDAALEVQIPAPARLHQQPRLRFTAVTAVAAVVAFSEVNTSNTGKCLTT